MQLLDHIHKLPSRRAIKLKLTTYLHYPLVGQTKLTTYLNYTLVYLHYPLVKAEGQTKLTTYLNYTLVKIEGQDKLSTYTSTFMLYRLHIIVETHIVQG